MTPMERCLVAMARLGLSKLSLAMRPSATSIPRFLVPASVQTRQATTIKKVKKKPLPKNFDRHNLEKRNFPRFSLCSAMRILRASEVGSPPTSVRYEIHINLKTSRSGPVIKSSLQLPHPVQSDWRIAVICPEGSSIAHAATAAGAVAVGEESIFQAVREGNINFDRLYCHEVSEKALEKAAVGKFLGPKGLMPNKNFNTIVQDVPKVIREAAGALQYRERSGVIHLAIGQLSHTPEELKANIKALLAKVKAECAEMSEEMPKVLHEVILSTTHGPALSLDGKFRNETDVSVEALSCVM